MFPLTDDVPDPRRPETDVSESEHVMDIDGVWRSDRTIGGDDGWNLRVDGCQALLTTTTLLGFALVVPPYHSARSVFGPRLAACD